MANIPYPEQYDDSFMNIFKRIIDELNSMGYTYEESLQKAQDILEEAKQTNDMNESVQQQINTLIAESGTSDAEVLQARIDAEGNEYNVLKDRLDESDDQLVQTAQLGSGKGDDIWNPPTQPEINSHFVDGDYLKNHIYPEWIGFFDSVYSQNEGYVTKQVLGKIYQDRYDFPVYTFTPENGFSKKLILGAGMHGGEKLAVISLYKFLKHLCEDWETNPQLAYIRNNVQLIVMPLQNPFGLAYHSRTNGDGVDINRNFNYKWNEYPTKEPFDADYKGTAPESETETQYIKQILNQHSDAIAYIDFHNMSAVTQGNGYSNTCYIPKDLPFNRKILVELMERLNPNGDTYNIGLSDNPSGFTYATNQFGMHSFNPEYTPGHHATAYSSEDMTKALEWVANVVFKFANLQSKVKTDDKFNPFNRQLSINRSTANAYPINVGSYAEINQLKGGFKPSTAGVAKVEYMLTYSSDDPTASIFFCPYIHQIGNNEHPDPSLDLTYYRGLFEVYEKGNGERRTLYMYSLIKVDDGLFKDTVEYGVYAYTTAGKATILKLRNLVTFIPDGKFEATVI